MVDLHKDRVRYIVSEFKAQSLDELIRCKYVGNHRSMSYEEELEILDSFAEKAHLGQITSVQEIKAAFDAKLGRETSGRYIYMLLTCHGWRARKAPP